MGKIYDFLNYKIENSPTNFSWFHLLFLALDVIAIVILVVKIKNPSEKILNKILLIAGITLITLEIYKQFIFSFNNVDGKLVFDYQWYITPFQFCSVPMYLFFITPFTKGKVREAILCFLATFGLFGGLGVMLYADDVFTTMLGINIQTMIHHGSMLVIGVYLLLSKRVKIEFKSIIKGSYVFFVCVVIALVIDIVFHTFTSETVNMFFISPYFPCTLPVLSIIYPLIPYPLFLILYCLGFILVATIVMYLFKLGMIVVNKLSHNPKNTKEIIVENV